MDLTRYTASHRLSYGEELALYGATGATPILDEADALWTYVLPGVVVADGKIAEILAGAENIVAPPRFYEPFILDDIFTERPRKYEPKVAGVGASEQGGSDIVLAGAPGEPGEFDIDKIDWGAGSPPSSLWEMTNVSEERVRSVWKAWGDAASRESSIRIYIMTGG